MINGVMERAAERVIGSMNNVPKVKMRRLPHTTIDKETKKMMEEAKKYRILKANGIDYNLNRRKLLEVRERIREIWRESRNEMWKELVHKTDVERNPRNFWSLVFLVLR